MGPKGSTSIRNTNWHGRPISGRRWTSRNPGLLLELPTVRKWCLDVVFGRFVLLASTPLTDEYTVQYSAGNAVLGRRKPRVKTSSTCLAVTIELQRRQTQGHSCNSAQASKKYKLKTTTNVVGTGSSSTVLDLDDTSRTKIFGFGLGVGSWPRTHP